MKLRPYQENCITAIKKHFRTSSDSCIVSASTGAGKTIIFSTLIKEILSKALDFRILIIAHRRQLLERLEKEMNK